MSERTTEALPVPMSSRHGGTMRLYYETAGQGAPLLLLHGLGSSARDWEYQVRFFAQRYRVLIPELRGHGRSEKPPGPYSMPLFASDIADLIESLGIAPPHVVGLSLGGFVAFQLAVDYPELIRSLVVVNSAPGLPRERLRDRSQLASALVVRRLIVRLFGMRTLGRFLGRKLFPRPEQAALKRAFIERWAENNPDAYLASLATVSGWSVEDRLDSIACPVCVIAGEYDFIPLKVKQSCADRVPNGELIVIPASGHFTPMDNPDELNRTVMSFLERQG